MQVFGAYAAHFTVVKNGNDIDGTTEIAGQENAGLEIDGQKLQGVENDGHSIKG